jgi:S-formylglutathione hydrolase
MEAVTIELGELKSSNLPEVVPYSVVAPAGYGELGPLPLCILLMGGGGNRQSLVDMQPLLERWWSEGSIPPMVFATPSPGMSYYVQDPDEGVRWESFLAREFVPHLRAAYQVDSIAITGISMGGYGALKTAFSHPEAFEAVAAMQPMLEPGFEDGDVGARNRIHHVAGGPARLIGPGRDAALFAANQPANLARRHLASIRSSGLAIYIDAGDEDLVNAHDGAEFLHRVLWDLDLSHEYHLVRGGDHGGPTMHPRMRTMFGWVGGLMRPDLDGEAQSGPTSREFLRALRAQLEPLREKAGEADRTTRRRFGILPKR